jgi:hypothetical protein
MLKHVYDRDMYIHNVKMVANCLAMPNRSAARFSV